MPSKAKWKLLFVLLWTMHGLATGWTRSLTYQHNLPNTEVIASGVVVSGQEYGHFRPCSSNPSYPGFERWTVQWPKGIADVNAQKLGTFKSTKHRILKKH